MERCELQVRQAHRRNARGRRARSQSHAQAAIAHYPHYFQRLSPDNCFFSR